MQIWIYTVFITTWYGCLNVVYCRAVKPPFSSGTSVIAQRTVVSATPTISVDTWRVTASAAQIPGSWSVSATASLHVAVTTNKEIHFQSKSEANTFFATEPRPEIEIKQAEPHTEGEALAEGESTSEAISEQAGESEPYTEPETWPEPGPRWSEAFEKWKAAWYIHVYFFAIAFLAIGFYAGYYVILNIYDGLGGKYLSVCLNGMVLLFGTSRAFVLFLDPYHQGGLIKALFTMRLLWSIGGPCLTASDSLIILALVETARVSIAPPRFQKLGTISIVITFHFVLVIVSDSIVSTYMEAKIMILLCQLFFSIWGITLGAGYANLAYKLDKQLFSHKQIKEKGDKIYIFLIYASAAANFFICGVMIYTAVGVFGVYTDIEYVDAWHWWTLQTLFRTGEVITCVLIFTVSAKRSRVKRAADEVSEFDSRSQTFDPMDGCSAFRKVRSFFDRFRKRATISDIADAFKDDSETTVGVNRSSFKRRTASKGNDDDDVLPPVFEAFQERGRGRRQDLFSHMRVATVENQIAQLDTMAPAVAPRPRRGRRQSLFSAMHEASINSAISSFAQHITEASEEPTKCESFEKDGELNEEPKPPPRRGRRTNIFSNLPETKPEVKNPRRGMMEDITEESTVYEGEGDATRKRPPLLKMRSSDRMRHLIFTWLSRSKGSSDEPIDIAEEEEPKIDQDEKSGTDSLPTENC